MSLLYYLKSPKPLRYILKILCENTHVLKCIKIPGDLEEFIILHFAFKKLEILTNGN